MDITKTFGKVADFVRAHPIVAACMAVAVGLFIALAV